MFGKYTCLLYNNLGRQYICPQGRDVGWRCEIQKSTKKQKGEKLTQLNNKNKWIILFFFFFFLIETCRTSQQDVHE